MDDANINLADAANPRYKKLTPEQKASHLKNGECLYCGQKGHFAQNCRECPARCPQNREGPRIRVTETGEEAPPETTTEETNNAAVVSRIYHNPQYHFQTLEPANDEAEDF